MSAAESTERGPIEPATEPATAPRSPGDRVRALPGGVAAVAVGALLWVVSGLPGLVGGGVLFLAWGVLPATYAFAVGQVVLVAVTRPDRLLDIGLLPLALVELGLAGVLLGPKLRSADGRRTAALTLLGGGLLAGVALASHALWERLWVAATVLVGLGGLVAYGLHRYELVVLGKVPDPDSDTDADTDTGTDTDAEPDTDTGPDSDTDPDADSETAPDSDTETDRNADTGADPDPGDGGGSDPEGDGAETDRERARTDDEPASKDRESRDGPGEGGDAA